MELETPLLVLLVALVLFVCTTIVWLTLRLSCHGRGGSTAAGARRTASVRTLIVLGSGGHTAEMLHVCSRLNPLRYRPRVYVCAATDALSASAAERLEARWSAEKSPPNNVSGADDPDLDGEQRPAQRPESPANADDYSIVYIQRSRAVKQSYLSAVWTTARAFAGDALPLVWRFRPDLVLCNGPGTAVPLVVAAWLLRAVRRLDGAARFVFVESFCRVRTVSLSGRLLAPLVDMFVVQWPDLATEGPASGGRRYLGKLM